MKKKIGILGTGMVGVELAKGFAAEGYGVMIGTRDISKLAPMDGVRIGSQQEAASFGEIIVLAVKGKIAVEALEGLDIDGKTVIDATNPIADEPPVDGVLRFFTKQNESLIGDLQKAYPNAHFVKAFNIIGAAHMYKPDFGATPTMFICGNNENSKKEVAQILSGFGWETEDMGGTEAGAPIESLCMLWCIPGFRQNRWSHAFKLLK